MFSLVQARALLLSSVVALPLFISSVSVADERCGLSFKAIETTTEADWSPHGNIFGKSLVYMIPSAIGVLVGTQILRHYLMDRGESPVFSKAFPVTIANDTLTTLVSHYIATSKLDRLKRFINGKGRNGEVGFWRRAGANTLLGTALINLTWLGAGMEVGVEQFCGALGLCAVVYPSLQAIKTKLYKRLPLKRDARQLESLRTQFPEEVETLQIAARQRAQELGIALHEAEYLILTALDAVLSAQAVEDLPPDVRAHLPPRLDKTIDELLRLRPALEALGTNLDKLSKADAVRWRTLVDRQRTLRRELFNALLDVELNAQPGSPLQQQLRDKLSFGETTSWEFSRALHHLLRTRITGYNRKLAAASAVDMMIAIGFFGGVCLEAVNYWAMTGETPPVLQSLADM